MCVVFPMCISVFPLYSHYRMDELLVSFYTVTLSLSIFLLLIFRSHSLVYSSLSLPIIVCRTCHGASCLYSYIGYLSLYIHLPQFLLLFLLLRPYSIPTNFHSPSPTFRYHPFSFPSYLSVPGCIPLRISPSNFLYQLPSLFLHSILTNFHAKNI